MRAAILASYLGRHGYTAGGQVGYRLAKTSDKTTAEANAIRRDLAMCMMTFDGEVNDAAQGGDGQDASRDRHEDDNESDGEDGGQNRITQVYTEKISAKYVMDLYIDHVYSI